ncbi:hypothetical protein ACVMB0_007602 [Bradyrhizobium sp. USDA 4451]
MPASWTGPRICQMTIIAADYALLHEQLQKHDQFLAVQTRLVGPTQSHLLAAK